VTPLLLAILFAAGIALVYDGATRPAVPTLSERRGRWTDNAEAFLRRAGLEGVSVREFALISAGAGVATGLVAQLVLGWLVLSIAVGGLGLVAPLAYFAPRQERRRAAVQVALVEATAQLRAAIVPGLSVQQCLNELALEVLRPEFSHLALDMQLKGLVPALESFRERLADPLADQIVGALLLNDRVGGKQVGAVLDRLTEATRAELAVEQEAKARQGQVVLSARVVALVPAVVLVGLRLMAPTFTSVYDGPAGQIVLVGCFLWVLLGYAVMLWMGRLPHDRRVLVR
jgi:tight adherence protein B